MNIYRTLSIRLFGRRGWQTGSPVVTWYPFNSVKQTLRPFVKKVSVKPKTFQKYDSTLRLYILPLLGEIKITAITPQQVQTVLNNWSNGTLKGKKGHVISSSTIRCTRRYLSELFEYAVNIGLLLKNPIKLTKPPRLITTEIHTLSLDEIHQLTITMKQQVSNNISSPYRVNYYASVNDTLRMYKNDDIRMYNFNCITDTIVEVITTCNTYTLLTVHLL